MFTTPFSFMAAPAGGEQYLLDTYGGAKVAYSVRRLSSTYSGSALRVRRSSDDTEQDIGFVGEDLDTAALSTFCSGTDGFVKTWYDQSGNAINYTQTTSANQPKIVSTGSIITVSGVGSSKPAVSFNGTSSVLNQSGGVWSGLTSATTYNVAKTNTTGGGFWSYNADSGAATHHPWNDGNAYEGFFNSSRYGFASSGLFLNQHLYTVLSKANDFQAYINKTLAYSNGTNTVQVPPSNNGKLGANSTQAFWFNGFFQEHIIYNSDNISSRTGIENNQNTYFQVVS